MSDGHGGTTTQTITVPLPTLPGGGDSGGGGPGSGGSGGVGQPIVLDLDRNGFALQAAADSQAFYDIKGDGWRYRMGWTAAGSGDGFLAFDANGDGRIAGRDELSFKGYKSGAQTDLEGLAGFDSNGDGRLSAFDDQWNQLRVWRDANADGMSDPGEVVTLAEAGVAEILLASDGQFSVANGNTINGRSNVTMSDGSTVTAADVTLQVSDQALLQHADGTSEVVTRPAVGPGAEQVGTEVADYLIGTIGNDHLVGLGDDDFVFDDQGNDTVESGDGNDTVYTGADEDLVLAGAGRDVVFAGLGNDLLFGEGDADALFGEGGNDIVFAGDGDDLVSGGFGNDVSSGDGGDDVVSGEAGADALFGGAGNDQLLGGDGDDRLQGDAGDDLLDGGAGADSLIGGTGNDVYAVDDANDAITENAGQGIDTVRTSLDGYALGATLENLVLTDEVNAANPGSDTDSADPRVAHTATGNDLDNLVAGNSANNALFGAGGNDTLNGGLGADAMDGGSGDDTYVADDVRDVVIERAGEGIDVVKSSVSYALAANVENLTLVGPASIDGTGNELDNTLVGNDADNRIDGKAGADLMRGGRGDDLYVIDNAGDAVVEAAEEGTDAVEASIDYALTSNVENLTLVGAAMQASGNELDNLIRGDALANRIDGAAGMDVMVGGAGDDLYVVDDAGDRVIEIGGEGEDTVQAGVSYGLDSAIENLSLTGSGDIDATGNELDNVLSGNAGNNRLDGGAGADAMAGGQGDDSYVVDDAGDVVNEAANEGTDSVLASIGYALTADVENLTLTGGGDIDATGNVLDNALSGNAGNNRLDGGAGADMMAGGAGDDSYVVDDAGDRVIESANAGFDQVFASIDYRLADEVEQLTLVGAALSATGNALDNLLFGNELANVLDGAAGADRMAGGLGDDTYVVDSAGDVVVEATGAGNDAVLASVSYALASNVENLTLTGTSSIDAAGNELANALTGNAGSNVLDGGAGADVMSGGAGDDGYFVDDAGDRVVESAGQGFDRVTASIDYVLTANVEQLSLTEGALIATGNDLDNLLFGNDRANVLDGRAGADQMSGGNGDDRYVVDNAGDAVIEAVGGGNDTVVSSVSRVLSSNVENLILVGAAAIGATGNDDANVLVGNTGANGLAGAAGNDVLAGGAGNDVLDGGADDDLYLYNQGDGRDAIVDTSGNDTLRFGAGITLDSLAARTVTIDGQSKVFVSVLATDGTEQQDQGIELSATGGIERFEFADGSVRSLADLMIAGRTLTGDYLANTITGDRSDDTINADAGDDIVYGRTGNDVVHGAAGADKLFGEGGNDKLYGDSEADQLWGGAGDDLLDGGTGNDQLAGGKGNDQLNGGYDDDVIDGAEGADALVGDSGEDRLFGGAGNDTLDGGADADLLAAGDGDDVIHGGVGLNLIVAGAGNDAIDAGTDRDFIDAGAGNDTIATSNGSDFIAAGKGNDTIDTGGDRDIVAFDRGDGADVVVGSGFDRDTLSLGGGIRYADLALRKNGSDLVLDLGQSESISFKDWYTSNGRRSIDTLQMVTVGGDYDAASSDRMKNRKVVSFDFESLANRFDAVRAANPAMTSWSVASELNGYFKSNSDTQAIGGDLAYRYATTGSYGDVDWSGVRSRMSAKAWTSWQTLSASTSVDPWTALQAGASLIADQTVGLPSPITPVAPQTSDQLAFAALNASGRPPTWVNQGGHILP